MEGPASLSCAENIALLHFLHAGRKEGTIGKGSVPARPSVAPVESLTIHRDDYVLSFERERSLASALAYLSNINDDPNRIPAICIEENHRPGGKSSLQILLAVNKSECKDGDKFLQTIKTSFEGIFATLSQVADDNDDQVAIEHEIRRLIIFMCMNRILHRLHFKKRKNMTRKQQAKEKFQNVIRALSPHGTAILPKLTTVSDEVKTLFLDRAKEIIRLIDTWINHPKPRQLEDLVDGFYRLHKLDCQAVLNTIPDAEIDRSSKISLMNMIMKVARYAEAARYLFRTAKKFPIARRMQVVLVGLPENAFLKTHVEFEYRLSLSCMLTRIGGPQKTRLTGQGCPTGTVCGLLHTTQVEADNDLTEQTCKTLTTGKVHAEVQLVFYCEMLKKFEGLSKNLLPPRIVSSSKKACFLCNLLVSMHGKMRTPWCHGKLYPGWRLPKCAEMDLHLKFNQLLEERIRESLALLIKRRGKTNYPGPSESTLITLPSLGSETVGALPPGHDGKAPSSGVQVEGIDEGRQDHSDKVIGDNKSQKSSSGSSSSLMELGSVTGGFSGEANERSESGSDSHHRLSNLSCKTERIAERDNQPVDRVVQDQSSYSELEKDAQSAQTTSSPKDSDYVDRVKYDDDIAEDQDRPDIVNDSIKSPDPEEQSFQCLKPCEDGVNSLGEYCHLRQGQKRSQTLRPKHTKTFFTRSLVVQVEYSTGSSLNTGKQPRKLSFSVDRLGVDEIARLKGDGTIPIVNAEAMIGDNPPITLSMDGLYVAASGVVFKITFH